MLPSLLAAVALGVREASRRVVRSQERKERIGSQQSRISLSLSHEHPRT